MLCLQTVLETGELGEGSQRKLIPKSTPWKSPVFNKTCFCVPIYSASISLTLQLRKSYYMGRHILGDTQGDTMLGSWGLDGG